MNASASVVALSEDERSRAPVTFREVATVVCIVVASDMLLYRGHGFSGMAAFLICASALLCAAVVRPRFSNSLAMLAGMLAILAARLVWLGSVLGVVVGLALLVAVAIGLHGRRPQVIEVLTKSFGAISAGYLGFLDYGAWFARFWPKIARLQWITILLPLAAVVFFGSLFILANPDLVTTVFHTLDSWMQALERWWMEIPVTMREMLFWAFVAWMVIGFVRPYSFNEPREPAHQSWPTSYPQVQEGDLYRPIRNTLVAVIGLFAIYLVFEFRTLWFREFPKGFYYAGYAHQGAAWLTTALAFSTLTLSLIFRGSILKDGRVAGLRTLAWIWSAENLVLALTVFNRLQIYVNFNGMTRMRTIALFGTSTVVAGFLLVVWKIARNHNFAWLFQRQLQALAIAVLLYAVTPVDAIVHWYNARHILAGDLPPAVQISSHPIDSEGVMMLEPLLDCQDPHIRDGVRALFAGRAVELESTLMQRTTQGWTSYQAADTRCYQQLQACKPKWQQYLDYQQRRAAWDAFDDYAYQWY